MSSTTYYDFVLADGSNTGAPQGTTIVLTNGFSKLSQDVVSGDWIQINGKVGQVVEVGTNTVTNGVGSARTILNTLGA